MVLCHWFSGAQFLLDKMASELHWEKNQIKDLPITRQDQSEMGWMIFFDFPFSVFSQGQKQRADILIWAEPLFFHPQELLPAKTVKKTADMNGHTHNPGRKPKQL